MIRSFCLRVMIFLSLSACHSKKTTIPTFNAVEIETIVEDTNLNVRAIDISHNELVAVSSIGDIYRYNLYSNTLSKNRFFTDTLNVRSLAVVGDDIFTLSIGNPALLHKNFELVYAEHHPNVFYDSMHFWDTRDGIAMGDPTDNCLSILITRDGGNHWRKIPCDQLPVAIDGEAAFAASDTNIKTLGDAVWIASGGRASRILYSSDRGLSWKVFNTPIIQGTSTTGIYSLDFYNSENGFAIGGDYTQPKSNFNNAIRTSDGGVTWKVIGNIDSPGYRSCVQYVPKSNAQGLVAMGFEGIDYSSNGGQSWTSFSKEGFYTFRFLNDTVAFAAGKGRISRLHFKKGHSND